MEQNNSCIVVEYGWIIIGKVIGGDATTMTLADASVVRNWNNGRGIGGIAKKEYKDEYKLDPIGDVVIRSEKVLFAIPCEW